jgi:hypothetical protein
LGSFSLLANREWRFVIKTDGIWLIPTFPVSKIFLDKVQRIDAVAKRNGDAKEINSRKINKHYEHGTLYVGSRNTTCTSCMICIQDIDRELGKRL